MSLISSNIWMEVELKPVELTIVWIWGAKSIDILDMLDVPSLLRLTCEGQVGKLVFQIFLNYIGVWLVCKRPNLR
jgi:hypothetical protein